MSLKSLELPFNQKSFYQLIRCGTKMPTRHSCVYTLTSGLSVFHLNNYGKCIGIEHFLSLQGRIQIYLIAVK